MWLVLLVSSLSRVWVSLEQASWEIAVSAEMSDVVAGMNVKL